MTVLFVDIELIYQASKGISFAVEKPRSLIFFFYRSIESSMIERRGEREKADLHVFFPLERKEALLLSPSSRRRRD